MCSWLLSILCTQQASVRCLVNETFYSCRVKFERNFDATLTACGELKPLRFFLSTQTLVPWLFGHNFRTRTVGFSLVSQLVKYLPAMWEVWVWSLVWEDSLEKEKATPSSILAWRISWPLESMGHKSDTTEWLSFTERWMHLLLIVTLLDGKPWMFGLLFHVY